VETERARSPSVHTAMVLTLAAVAASCAARDPLAPALASAPAPALALASAPAPALALAPAPLTDSFDDTAKQSSRAACPAAPPEGMVCIPGGAFVRGDDRDVHARPAEQVTVSTFLLDVDEVTNAEWSACVAAGECRRLLRFVGYTAPEQPAVGMRWEEAVAFCARRGARLPTEAEWERAASGPDDTLYPWGDAPGALCEHAIVRTREGRGCGRETTWPVGSRAADRFGLHDMAGNVWEWVQDAYADCYRGCARECGDACSGVDPRGPCGGDAECPASRGLRVVRGGSWWHDIDRAVVTARRGVPAANPNPHRFGFRCARTP
jgi:sulfatase modifying factor 1